MDSFASRFLLVFGIGIAAGGLLAAGAEAGERTVPLVVELFTSQGCNSCPPADAYLSELAQRPDVLALSLHVDYWDYIGWKDPFAQHAFTLRQRDYSRALAQRYVYTPQMVINGELQGVGSERDTIETLLARAAKERQSGTAKPPVIRYKENQVRIEGGSATPAIVWLAIFDAKHATPIARGENAGRNLNNYNVVREWRELGRYTGKPMTIALDMDDLAAGQRGCAVLVQSETTSGPGRIVSAYVMDPPAN